jgi:hypothetical protein
MFRLLGVHPGPDISVPAAASLAGTTHAQARRDLAELSGAHLVTEHVPGRYSAHDLLHAYLGSSGASAHIAAVRSGSQMPLSGFKARP